MELAELLPVWKQLTPAQQKTLERVVVAKKISKGTMVHDGDNDCMGMIFVQSGQLRAYSLSEEGREVTLYRLFERDVCLFSASCVMRSIQFEVFIAAEKDSQILVIPPWVYKEIVEESAPFANFANEIMATRFSDVMWRMEQIMWKSMDKRLAAFLLEEANLEGSDTLAITHETIANHLGTAREVVTRMLRYFQSEGIVKLTRGVIELTDKKALNNL